MLKFSKGKKRKCDQIVLKNRPLGNAQSSYGGYDDPYYHNYDPDVYANVDEEWFQGRDRWD